MRVDGGISGPWLPGVIRNAGEQRTQALRNGRVGDDGIAHTGIGQPRQHRHLHRRHDLAGLGTDHRKAEDAVVACPDEPLPPPKVYVPPRATAARRRRAGR